MALQTEPNINSRHHASFNASYNRTSRNEPPLRERPNTKFRIKSELRGAIKMPPIVSTQTNTSTQLGKNILFPASKTPMRRTLISKGDVGLPHLEDNHGIDNGIKPFKPLTIDTTPEPKHFVPSQPNERGTVSPLLPSDNALGFMDPLTNKPSYSTPGSTNSFQVKSRSTIRSKGLSTRRHVNSRVPEISGERRVNASDAVGTGSFVDRREKRDLSTGLENTNSIAIPVSQLPSLEPTRCSTKKSGVIRGYAANTNQGLVRDYNEDRVAIILNIMKPLNLNYEGEWPMCSFFGVYDGHGGTECADFLRDNLHQFVIKDRNFPFNPVEALRNGFQEAERQFTELAQQQAFDINRSGSCAIVALIIDDMCYIANVGDSRAVMSSEQGKKAAALSRDHKPNEDYERDRIISNGGKVYQTSIPIKQGNQPSLFPKTILGPHRVFPGRLSVSRTFGDIEAKIIKYGGLPGVVVADPEIMTYKLTKDSDFIVLACDGIFDKLEDDDVVKCVWDSTKAKLGDLHKQSSLGVENILNESMARKTFDNVTAVLVVLEGFQRAVTSEDTTSTTSPAPVSKRSNTPGRIHHDPLPERIANGTTTRLQGLIGHNPLRKSADVDNVKDGHERLLQVLENGLMKAELGIGKDSGSTTGSRETPSAETLEDYETPKVIKKKFSGTLKRPK